MPGFGYGGFSSRLESVAAAGDSDNFSMMEQAVEDSTDVLTSGALASKERARITNSATGARYLPVW
jgi:hypothetical protein